MTLLETDLKSFYIIALIALLMGAILMVLTGFIHVKKGYTAIIEKLGEYYGTYKEGFHYFPPFVYRRVGMYKNINEIEIPINKKKIRIKVKIENVKKYHYSPSSFNEIIAKLDRNNYVEIDEYINALNIELNKIGCSLTK